MPYMTKERAAAAVVELRNAAERYRQLAMEHLDDSDPLFTELNLHTAHDLFIAADIINKRYVLHEHVKAGRTAAPIQDNLRKRS